MFPNVGHVLADFFMIQNVFIHVLLDAKKLKTENTTHGKSEYFEKIEIPKIERPKNWELLFENIRTMRAKRDGYGHFP